MTSMKQANPLQGQGKSPVKDNRQDSLNQRHRKETAKKLKWE